MKLRGKSIKGIPADLIQVDENTGELCVGDDCFRVKASRSEIAVEVNPAAKCNSQVRDFAKTFLQLFVENNPTIKIREKRRVGDVGE